MSSYTSIFIDLFIKVPTTAKLVHVDWVKECKDEIICENPHAKGAYHPDVYCKEQIKVGISSFCVLSRKIFSFIVKNSYLSYRIIDSFPRILKGKFIS